MINEVNIKHCFFSRKNGVSSDIRKFKLWYWSNDDTNNVKKNLEIVSKTFNIESNRLALMNQTHSNKVTIIDEFNNLKDLIVTPY